MTDSKTVSVAVLCYNNFTCIYDAIQSVLDQAYDSIELIVSDDASESFPAQEIEGYIRERARKNIKRVLVRTLEKNGGTVKHLNSVLNHITGEYIHFLAADDVFHDEHVIEKYVTAFDQLGSEASILYAQTAMYDESLKTFQYYYLRPYMRRMLETGITGPQLYQALVRFPSLPTTSTMFRTSFLLKYGCFDERFKLIEDVPMHLRLAKEKMPLHYANFVAIKHRHGGISHGQSRALKKSQIWYLEDSIRVFKDAIREIRCQKPSRMRTVSIARCRNQIFWCEYALAQRRREKMCVYLRHPAFLLDKLGDDYGLGGRIRVFPQWIAMLGIANVVAADAVYGLLRIETAEVAPMILRIWSILGCGTTIAAALLMFLFWIARVVYWTARFPNQKYSD